MSVEDDVVELREQMDTVRQVLAERLRENASFLQRIEQMLEFIRKQMTSLLVDADLLEDQRVVLVPDDDPDQS